MSATQRPGEALLSRKEFATATQLLTNSRRAASPGVPPQRPGCEIDGGVFLGAEGAGGGGGEGGHKHAQPPPNSLSFVIGTLT